MPRRRLLRTPAADTREMASPHTAQTPRILLFLQTLNCSTLRAPDVLRLAAQLVECSGVFVAYGVNAKMTGIA